MQRISVDLPEPEGPQMTIFSPCATHEVDIAQHVELAEPLVHAGNLDGIRGRRAVGIRLGVNLGHIPSPTLRRQRRLETVLAAHHSSMAERISRRNVALRL